MTNDVQDQSQDQVAPNKHNSAHRTWYARVRGRLSITGWIGVIVFGFCVLVAIFGEYLAPYGENDLPFPTTYGEFRNPQPGAWLGTDVSDRDVLSRMMYGARRTIGISLCATLLAYLIGVISGIGAAIAGRNIDMVLSRINDVLLSLPPIMLGLIIVAAFGSSIPILVLTAGIVYATVVFRLARAIGMEIVAMDFVEAAKVRGEGLWWIIVKEIWPNAAMPLMSDFGLRLIYIILFVSSLSFLGLGLQPPQADWGSMVRENLGSLQYGESIVPVVAPAIAIAMLTVAINLIVDDVSVREGGQLFRKM